MDNLKNIECYKNALIRMYQGEFKADDYYLLRTLIDDHEMLIRENKALEDDNYQKCVLNEELAKENKILLERVKSLEDRLL